MTELNYPYYTRKIARNSARRIMAEQHVPNVNKHMSDQTDEGQFWKDVLQDKQVTKLKAKKKTKTRNTKRRHK